MADAPAESLAMIYQTRDIRLALGCRMQHLPNSR
ncbi:hypothetical protein KFU94_66420 [Chloroflexi bacterium TSY]|nr:hypothetical protein [Chloroflexi bacterium TSY]